MTPPDRARQIAEIASLEEPVRRELYFYVAGQPAPVSRDAAARAVRVSRALAAFHLDKLVAAGLLDASYRRLSGRRGPGAGRPAKVYRRSSRQVELSLPERRYELAARLFAESLAQTPASVTVQALRRAAERYGASLGRAARRGAGPRPSRDRLLGQATAVLRAHGFEPIRAAETIVLRNCPFAALARDYRALVCGMNLALLQGVVTGLGRAGIEATLHPQPGQCCVVLRTGASPRRRAG